MDDTFVRMTLLALALSAPGASWAHGGGLDASGCHTNRSTGDYHCHRGPASPSRRQHIAPSSFAPARAVPAAPAPAPAGRAYANCAEARAAGAALVHIGEPGYGVHLDRDRDGIGCEPYRQR